MARLVALILVTLIAAACSTQGGAIPAAQVQPAPSPSSSSSATTSPSPLPPGGISEAQAVALARGHSSLTNFVSASAGLFRDLNIDPNIGPGYPVKPGQLVWAVKFAGDVTPCNPLGVCFSPRPGITAVYLDYRTGDFLSAEGLSPAP